MNTPNNRKSSDDPRGNETSEKEEIHYGEKAITKKIQSQIYLVQVCDMFEEIKIRLKILSKCLLF